jgi:aspartokinase-like uncharacterized kinase
MPAEKSIVVVKVGGSVHDLPQLGAKLNQWLQTLSACRLALVPGGGAAADVVRDLDRRHALGQEQAHWLALAAMTLNARFLQTLIPGTRLITDVPSCQDCWREDLLPILDAYGFAVQDEERPGALPHSWDVTSDSVAARVATVFGARELILLKSVEIPSSLSWSEAAARGHVDPFFAHAAAGLNVKAIHFRAWEP